MRPLDLFFRNLLAILLVGFLFYGFSFRLRANTSEKLDRMQEGWPILVGLRLSGLALWITFCVWLWEPANLAWANIELPDWGRWLGVVVGALALGWLAWMFRTLGSNLTDTVVTRKGAHLVTGGPYRYVRHPMYVGVFMLGVFLSLVTANWLFLPLGALVFTMMRIRLPIEERNLIARFGDDYRTYMEATGRFLPRVGR